MTTMRATESAICALVAALILAGCSGSTSPPFAAEVTPATPQGLASLFSKECLEKRSLPWAKKLLQTVIDDCGGLGTSCETRLSREIEWHANASDGSVLRVAFQWPQTNDSTWPLQTPQCSISAPEALATEIMLAADLIVVDGEKLSEAQSESLSGNYDQVFGWRTPAGGGSAGLRLGHWTRPPDDGSWSSEYLRTHERYPWELSLASFQ